MTTTIQYTDNRQAVLDQYTTDGTMVLVAEYNHLEGNYLVFSSIEEFIDNQVRPDRNALLQATDFMILDDYFTNKLTSQEQTDVLAYREALRDLPSNVTDSDIPWPTKPQIVIDNGI